MSLQKHIMFWVLAFAGLIGVVFIFSNVLLPFVLGSAVAYLLNPLVKYLGKGGIPRKHAALVILTIFFLIVTLFIVVLTPFLYREIIEFLDNFPGYISKLSEVAQPLIERVESYTGRELSTSLKGAVKENGSSAVAVVKKLLFGLAAGGQAVFGFISLTVVMPIVAYFVMKDWDRITSWVTDLMPRHSKETIMSLLKEIDKKLAGFVRGQLSVAFILAIAYAVALSFAGLKYGLLIGIGSGVLSVIPMVGSTIGLLVSVGVAWIQSGEWSYVLLIAGIFLGGQLIEGNFLTPKLVGNSVGLHPLWVFFALMAGGALFGILGMLLAVPVASIIAVLSGFAIKQYKNSPFYEQPKQGKKKASSGKKNNV